jgi:hypothetical protein
MDSILNKECIGGAGSGCTERFFRSAGGHGSTRDDELSVDDHFTFVTVLECSGWCVVAAKHAGITFSFEGHRKLQTRQGASGTAPEMLVRYLMERWRDIEQYLRNHPAP